ncbi:MAG: hypothetical protein Q8Q54_04925 [Methylococcales bacterium]|nr:hypothetical protein [Methylococcales bacterium]MDP3838247.1 hypothetical protein [Methylococcales bacterium]
MTANLTQPLEKAATLPDVIQEEIALQWQATLEQPQPKLEQLALAALQQAKQGKTIKKGFDEL